MTKVSQIVSAKGWRCQYQIGRGRPIKANRAGPPLPVDGECQLVERGVTPLARGRSPG